MRILLIFLIVLLLPGIVAAACTNPSGDQGDIKDVFGYNSFCSDPDWDYAENNIGIIKYTNIGLYDNVAYNNNWYWCDSYNDGSEGADVTVGIELINEDKLTINGHDYVCFQNGIYETIAECCGDGACNSGTEAGERYATGERVGGKWTCQDSGTWFEESSPEDDIILKLSSNENAHAEIYNKINYNTLITYSDIFGSFFVGNPHPVCEAWEILELSGETNAHAEKIGQGNYDYSVCYGNLECNYKTECSADEESVVTISGDTNAHLGITGYATKLCCKSGCPSGQDYCPDSPVNTDPENPSCCLKGYYCSFGECVETEEECYESDTRGNYACFSDGIYTNPYDCLGIEGGPKSDKTCCYGCMQDWDYNCWASIEVY